MVDNKPLVLVADDERNAVILLTRILERDGFAVESARDGEIALDKARTLRPDLILMDVQMPKMNGFEVTEILREDPVTARIPVIFVTAAAREPSDVAHGFDLGADDYIRKPYNYHELLARAHSKMRARQLEDRLQRRSEEMEALVRIGGEFNQRLGLGELTNLILDVAGQELQADTVELCLLDDQRRPVLYQDIERGDHPLGEAKDLLARQDTIFGRVFTTGEPVLVSSDGQDAAIERHLAEEGLQSAAAAPLRHHGQLVGILVVAHRTLGRFGEDDLRMLRSIGEQAALAVRNAQLYAELRQYAQNLEDMVEVRTQELREAQAQLIQSEKLAALGRLAAGIAHEVNNPLQPILNCLEVTIEDIEHDDLVDAEVLRVAEMEVQRIKTLVSRLLDFARPSAAETEAVDVPDLVSEVLMLINKQLERMNVTLHTSIGYTQPVDGNPTQLKQVLLNLMINAMEAMPDGGSITLELYDHNDGVMLSLTDTGIGMPQGTIDRIFEPFYSTKDDGTGLGLSVTYGIVQGHGGEIRVSSEVGKGSRFDVWLPYEHHTQQ
ncbi:MAG: response regulator [Chloroflexi bacterium]|nr:response regulator [Chloroflexota bacterium]